MDVVVTLHACDTATDYALAKAIGWNAKVILSVPCCQHEVNGQFAKADKTQCYDGCLDPIMDYGLLRERFAALVTDGLRAKYLEAAGYDTQVLEFIDMEHTPKNILLRAVRADEKRVTKKSAGTAIEKCERFLQIEPTLGRLLADKGRITKNEEKIMKAGILIVVFCAAVIISSLVINKDVSDEAADMGLHLCLRFLFMSEKQK